MREDGTFFLQCYVVTWHRLDYLHAMPTLHADSAWRLDRLAMGLSGLCAVHCIATALLIGMFSSLASLFAAPIIHETGLVAAILLGALALGFGALRHGLLLPVAVGSLGLGVMAGALTKPHGTDEMVFTLLGLAILAFGHELNRRAH